MFSRMLCTLSLMIRTILVSVRGGIQDSLDDTKVMIVIYSDICMIIRNKYSYI